MQENMGSFVKVNLYNKLIRINLFYLNSIIYIYI